MITVFSTTKNFDGHFNVIQKNAIESWIQNEYISEILLAIDSQLKKLLTISNCLSKLNLDDRNNSIVSFIPLAISTGIGSTIVMMSSLS